ncbi:MAG: DUF4340 domain-containing protein [Bdellovibrionales bacterium]|nr:DUF4340 domain-containing protein [Bdellovibrionales bacterium]
MKALIRPTLSTILVIVFAFILLFLGLFAEVFESHTPEVDLAQIYANPIPVIELQHVKSLRITNKQGNFLLENTHAEGNLEGPWQMTEPQALKVKDDVIPKIVDALNVIRVRNFHRLEPINITSFSLDNPTLTLNFQTSKNKAYEIKMGLINPIDNSAYLSLSSQNQIYQIDPIEITLESYDISQLVESRVLALNAETLVSLEIYTPAGLEVKLLKKDDLWVEQNGLPLEGSKVKKYFERLEDLKSFSILNNLTGPQQEFMESAMATPIYTLKLISAQGVRSYFVAEIKKGIPGMNLARSNFYALSTEEKKSFVLIDKEQLKAFSLKSKDLK